MPKTFEVTRRVRLANRIATAMLRAGLKPGLAHLLSVRGRKSGRMRSTPVSPLDHEGKRYLVAGSHHAEWVRNVRVAGWAILSRGRRSERVGLVELDQARTAPILKAFAKMVGGGGSFFEAGPDSPLEAFEAEAPFHPVFEVVALPKTSRGHVERSAAYEPSTRPYEDRKRSRRHEYRMWDRAKDGLLFLLETHPEVDPDRYARKTLTLFELGTRRAG